MATKINLLYLVAFSLLAATCSRQNTETQSSSEAETVEINIVQLNRAQIERVGVTTGNIEKHWMADYIECNGSVVADPNQKALVSPLMKGYIQRIHVLLGNYVQRGTVLATLSHPGYIKLQQEYLETLSQYEYYKADFRRQGELSIENATSIKTMQQVQNDYRKTEARLFALKHQLSFLGINPDSLHVDKLITEVALVSPISGYVSKLNANLGMLCPEEIPLFEIVGNKNALLHLKVYENDAARIASGQAIRFTLISKPKKIYEARLKAVARTIDQNNTINLHANILNPDASVMPGMYVRAKILVNADSVFAVNTDALVQQQNSHFLFEKIDSITFKAHEVIIGRTYNEKTELLNISNKLLDNEIVLKGGYYLFAEMNKEE